MEVSRCALRPDGYALDSPGVEQNRNALRGHLPQQDPYGRMAEARTDLLDNDTFKGGETLPALFGLDDRVKEGRVVPTGCEGILSFFSRDGINFGICCNIRKAR